MTSRLRSSLLAPVLAVVVAAALCALVLGWHVTSGLQHLRSSWYD